MITAEMIRDLRDKTNMSLMECKKALERYDGDELLAMGYLKYNGCAINCGSPENYRKWVEEMAQSYKDKALKEIK